MAEQDPVFAARSHLANVCRHNGTAEAIAEARVQLDAAKAQRIRDDHARSLEEMDRSRVLVIGYAEPSAPARELHEALFANHREQCDEFKREHGPATTWDNSTIAAWTDLIASHRLAHVKLGCSTASSCTGANNRG